MIYVVCDRCKKKIEGSSWLNLIPSQFNSETFKMPKFIISKYVENGNSTSLNLCPDCENELEKFLFGTQQEAIE